MIYASEHFSTALLEKLVHGSGRLPPNQHYVEITIPPGVTYEMFDAAAHPGWDMATGAVSKALGETWQRSRRTLLLIVPSVVARPERNILINPEHPEFGRTTTSLHQPAYWDRRLFP
jgi:RES domain-containing protein